MLLLYDYCHGIENFELKRVTYINAGVGESCPRGWRRVGVINLLNLTIKWQVHWRLDECHCHSQDEAQLFIAAPTLTLQSVHHRTVGDGAVQPCNQGPS